MGNGDALDQMIQSYRDKLQQNPDSLVFVQLADCYRKKGLLEEATSTCEDGLKRKPELLSGQLMMGRIYMARRMHSEAVDSLRKVLQKEANNLTAHALLSQALTAMNRFQEAISEYQKILALNPEDTSAQKALQALLERMRREKEGPAAASVISATAAPARPVTIQAPKPSQQAGIPSPVAQVSPGPESSSPPSMEIPAYAAADELAERGLYDEAIEAYQHLLESEPDNFLARQKLRELYAMREAMESPMPSPEPAKTAETVETQAEKMTDDDILYLLGLMEGGPEEKPAAPAPKPAVKAEPMPQPKPEPKPEPVPEPKTKPKPEPKPEVKLEPVPEAVPQLPRVSDEKRKQIDPILARLASTEGMKQALLVIGQEILHAGTAPAAESTEKITTLVRMLADVTRRASTNMKHGEAKQVLMFGPQGIAVVSQSVPGILVLVAGASVKVGLLRLALNDCLKRLGEVN